MLPFFFHFCFEKFCTWEHIVYNITMKTSRFLAFNSIISPRVNKDRFQDSTTTTATWIC
jgi:hypothetical protein